MPIPKNDIDSDRAATVAINFNTKKNLYISARNSAAECGTQMQEIQNDWLEAERWVLTAERQLETAEKELDEYLKEIKYSGSRVAFVLSAMAEWEKNATIMKL